MRHLSRQQLYDLVWMKPMTEVAAELGISDVGLKKICRRHRVPAPFRGYWARLTAGQQPTRPALPPLRKDERDVIIIRGAFRHNLPPDVRVAEQQARDREAHPENKIAINKDIDGLGSFASRLLRAIRRTRRDYRGIASVNRADGLSVALAPENAERAAFILDALYKAAESRGYHITRGGNLLVDGATLRFQLHEKVDSIPLKPGIKGRPSRIARYMEWKKRNDPEWDFVATGRLVLTLIAAHGEGIRRIWSDGKRQRIEDCLNDVLTSVVACAAAETAWQEEQTRREAKWEKERQRRVETERLHLREERRWEFLDRCADELERAERAARFLAQLEATAPPVVDATSPLAQFLRWTRERCNILRRNASAAAVARALAAERLFAPEELTRT